MKRLISFLLVTLTLATVNAQDGTFGSVKPLSDNGCLIYGSGLAVRLQESGYFEAYLQIADADKSLQVRSLSYTGDQVHYRLRPAKFSAHLGKLLNIWKGQQVLLFFGQNESYDGVAGISDFKGRLVNFLAVMKGRHAGAKLTLVSPIAYEDLGNPALPNAGERNKALAAYAAAMKEIADSRGIEFVDLFSASQKLYAQETAPLTLDGLYLNDRGNHLVGKALASALRPGANLSKVKVDSPGFQQLKETVKQKAFHVAETYRPSNGVHYYSVRARSYEYEPEVPHHMTLANQLDRRIWRLAANPGSTLEPVVLPKKQAQPPAKAPRRGLGKIGTVEQDLSNFTVAKDFELTCFASEDDFPDLINPMQVRVGPKGRIWVSTFSQYPIPVPGEGAADKILILEDTDGDGKADKRTVFADNVMLPDGFVFYRDGLIVSVPRKLLWLRDTDGDDKADVTVEILAGIDDTDTHHGGFLTSTPNGKVTICDGVFHRTAFETPWGVVHSRDSVTLDFDPRTRRVTLERQTGAPNPWKITYNSWGEGLQMFGGGQTIDMDYYNLGLPAGSKPANYGGLFRHDKGCAMAAVTSPHFPDDWQNGTVSGHLLGRNTVIYTPLAQKSGAYTQSGEPVELIDTKNKVFRPVDCTFGLDGALYVSDLYYPIIGHAQHSVRDENRDYSHGRIYRLTYKKKPLLKAPKIKGEPLPALLNLLTHEQVRVRELARVEMHRFSDAEVAAAIKKWLPAKADDETSVVKYSEALWTYERRGLTDTSVIKALLASKHPQGRAIGARSLRHWAKHLGGDTVALAKAAIGDKADRVRLTAISSLSFLQWEDEALKSVLASHQEPKGSGLTSMLSMAQNPPESRMAPVVPILAPNAATRLSKWTMSDGRGTIWFKATEDTEVIIGSTGSSTINVDVNDLPVIRNAGSNFTSDYQGPATVKKGINKIDYFMSAGGKPPKKGRKPRPPAITLSNLSGQVPKGVSYPKSPAETKAWAAEYDKAYAVVSDTQIYIKTVPTKLLFNVNKFTVKAGKTYNFVLDNPDITMHNFLLTKPGKADAVGRLADALAATPDGMKKHFIPDSDMVLFATKQIPGGQKVEKKFTAPSQPGNYPYICSFPGHWAIMRGVMVVE
jgi:glucose/arabinose dehydrogenase/azurin